MLVSMTGFGFGHYEDKSVSIDVEIRSFNSRYFELQTRYFDLSGETEYKIRKFLKEKLKRGSVTLSIKIDSKNRFKVNNHKIESFLKAYKDIEKKYNLKLDYSQLFSSSDLVRFSTSNKVFDNKILKAIKIATGQVMVMRLREGSDIQKEFSRYIDIAKKDLSNIKSIYSKELDKLTSRKNISNSRIEEIEKLDVTEEIDRAKSHFNQIELSIKSKEFSGKKINFILQEINRESNTILSKFLNKKIAKYAISLKIQTEKLREQINNILWNFFLPYQALPDLEKQLY